MQIAIPTYGRAATIGKHVLAYLDQTDIPRDAVTLFVANADEATAYKALNPDWRVVIGEKGLVNQRRFIASHYEKGTAVFSMDDDVSGLDTLHFPNPADAGRKTIHTTCSFQPLFSISALLDDGFARCNRHGVGLWGFYPVRNKGFMDASISIGLKFIMGHAFGFFAGDPAFDRITDYSMKDDYYLTLHHFATGRGSLRYNGICVRSKAHTGAGGTCDDMERKLRINNGSVMRICGQYHGLATYKTRRTTDPWLSRYLELRLKPVTYHEQRFVYP